MKERFLKRRELLTKAIVTGIGGVGVVGSVIANQTATLPIDVEITGMADHMHIQRVTELTVEITNRGGSPLKPYFSTLREGNQTRFYWDVVSDDRSVAPQNTTTFRLKATNPGMAIPYEREFVLGIEDEDAEHGRFVSSNTGSSEDLYPIRNPSIDYWLAPLDRGVKLPFRWEESREQQGQDQVKIQQTENGAKLVAIRGSHGGPWTMAGLSQIIPVLEELRFEASPRTLTQPDAFRSGSFCGVELIDRNYRIWCLFTNTDSRTIRQYSVGSFEYHVEYIPAEIDQRQSVQIDLDKIYSERGWSPPPEQPLFIDGISYSASSMIVHPFSAVYAEGEQAAMVLNSITGSR